MLLPKFSQNILKDFMSMIIRNGVLPILGIRYSMYVQSNFFFKVNKKFISFTLNLEVVHNSNLYDIRREKVGISEWDF